MRGYITGLGCAPQLGHGVLRSHPPITGRHCPGTNTSASF